MRAKAVVIVIAVYGVYENDQIHLLDLIAVPGLYEVQVKRWFIYG
jgi:hypothetical protein